MRVEGKGGGGKESKKKPTADRVIDLNSSLRI